MATSLNELFDNYEFGWNITRSVLLNKEVRQIGTIFGNRSVPDCPLLRDFEAERLHRKYSLMLMRNDKIEYCRGAIDLINEWDRIGKSPELLEVFEDNDEDEQD
jgi:hypothetical protein